VGTSLTVRTLPDAGCAPGASGVKPAPVPVPTTMSMSIEVIRPSPSVAVALMTTTFIIKANAKTMLSSFLDFVILVFPPYDLQVAYSILRYSSDGTVRRKKYIR